MSAGQSKSSLRRTLGRTAAMLLTAAMIIGTGLFAALGETVEKAGSGLLLAMLLSGVVALLTGLSAASVGINFPEEGGGFTWSRTFGYPTLFVDVHNAADNVAAGHSAWAMNAIKRFLDEVAEREGPHSLDHSWHRVWAGVRAGGGVSRSGVRPLQE